MTPLRAAIKAMATALEAADLGEPFSHFTCDEVDSIALVLHLAGHDHEAAAIVINHTLGDEEPDDAHWHVRYHGYADDPDAAREREAYGQDMTLAALDYVRRLA